jgi:hypothetical protein
MKPTSLVRSKFALVFIGVALPLMASAEPVWSQNPLLLPDAKADALYTVDLSTWAASTKGSPLVFSMISGPSFLTLSKNGILAGVPLKADGGEVSFVVSVSDAQSEAQVVANLNVD